jgi:hypothetical protein
VARLYYSLIEYFKFFSNTLLSNKKKKTQRAEERDEQRFLGEKTKGNSWRERERGRWVRGRRPPAGEREENMNSSYHMCAGKRKS